MPQSMPLIASLFPFLSPGVEDVLSLSAISYSQLVERDHTNPFAHHHESHLQLKEHYLVQVPNGPSMLSSKLTCPMDAVAHERQFTTVQTGSRNDHFEVEHTSRIAAFIEIQDRILSSRPPVYEQDLDSLLSFSMPRGTDIPNSETRLLPFHVDSPLSLPPPSLVTGPSEISPSLISSPSLSPPPSPSSRFFPRSLPSSASPLANGSVNHTTNPTAPPENSDIISVDEDANFDQIMDRSDWARTARSLLYQGTRVHGQARVLRKTNDTRRRLARLSRQPRRSAQSTSGDQAKRYHDDDEAFHDDRSQDEAIDDSGVEILSSKRIKFEH